MCTIIKLKRKINEDPVECLILECKKKKISLDEASNIIDSGLANSNTSSSKKQNENSIKQILKYAGSAVNEADVPAKIIELSSKFNETSTNIKLVNKRLPKTLKKEINNEEKKTVNYVLVNKKRGLDDENDLNEKEIRENEDTNIDKKLRKSSIDNINIIDVVPVVNEKITCNGVELIREKIDANNKPDKLNTNESEFVYDIYLTKNPEIHLDLLYPNNYEIKSFNNFENVELVDDNQSDSQEEFYEDDEDSNDEGNWRNDYPDEEDEIDNEDDEEPYYYKRSNRNNDGDDDDEYYDNYANGYDDDDDQYDRKLSLYMKKSLDLDRSYHEDESENDDYDEYDREDDLKY